MKTIIKAKSLRGAEALLIARRLTIANAVHRNGVWEVTANHWRIL